MTKNGNRVVFCILFLIASGCAGFQPGYEKPTVTITSFEAVPAEGMVPKFKIGIHIINPNRTPLQLKGLSYTVSLEGHRIITGVSNQLPEIEAYGEGDVMLNASVDLFNSIGFMSDLIRNQGKDQISYDLDTKLDAGVLYPLIRVSKKGKLSLTQNPKSP
nr:LEA type 2 family protein [Desulfobacula sp.]